MKLKYILLSLMLAAVIVEASAQSRHRRVVVERDTVSALVHAYTDSLTQLRQRIDSLTAATQKADTDYAYRNQYYRLFVPLTFYHDIVQKRFSIGGDTTSTVLDEALMDVYFRRPDLVRSTQSKMEGVGPIFKPDASEVLPSVDMVERVAPRAEDTQVDVVDIMLKRPNFWKFAGEFRLDLSQNYYSGNWSGGGESNYSTRGYLKFYAKYDDKKRFFWEHTLEGTLGFNSSKTDTIHSVKTNNSDLHYKSKLNLRAIRKWSYTLQLDAKTQMMRIFDNNSYRVKSDFGSPLYLNLSVGMSSDFKLFKGKVAGNVNLGAFSYNYRYVDRLNLASSFGVKNNRHSLQDYGSRLDLNFNVSFIKNLTWRVESYGYTSYKRFEAQILNKFDFRFNKYLATHFEFYSRFDDSRARDEHHGYWQFRDYLTFGLSFNF